MNNDLTDNTRDYTLSKNEQENSDYVLAVHSIKVHNEGTVANVRPIWDDIKNIDQLGIIILIICFFYFFHLHLLII